MSVMAEVDRILRPQGPFIVRDDMEKTGEIEKMVESLKWNVKNDTFQIWRRSDLCPKVIAPSYRGRDHYTSDSK